MYVWGNLESRKNVIETLKLHGATKNFIRFPFIIFNIIIFLTVIYGAFMAGLDAGQSFNTWPKMLGEWIPEAVYIDSNGYNSMWFLEHRWGVQFIHRKIALILFSTGGLSKRKRNRSSCSSNSPIN